MIILLLLLLFFFSMAYSAISFAPWVPSRKRDLERIFKLADLKPGQIFYDLGCGDGKIVFYAAKKHHVNATGLEISAPLYLICLLKKIFNKEKNVKFKLKNLFKENLSKADAVYFFGIPATINNKLKEKLKKELKPGAKIISYSFKLDDWTPVAVNKPAKNDLPVYLYVV